MREDRPVKVYWVRPSANVRWLCKQYFDGHRILLDECVALREITAMGVDLEVDKLATNLTEQVDKLTKKVAEVNDKLTVAFGETHATVSVVDEQVGKLATMNAKLKALVGGQTNNPPPGDLPT